MMRSAPFKGTVHHRTCVSSFRSSSAVCGGGGRLEYGSRGCPLTEERLGRKAASLRLFQQMPVPRRMELRCVELQAAGVGTLQ